MGNPYKSEGNPYLEGEPSPSSPTSVPDIFEIEDSGRGTFDIRRNGRPWRYDRDDVDEAMRDIAQAGGGRVILIEPDGYRREVRT